jgi:hypothetical protein
VAIGLGVLLGLAASEVVLRFATEPPEILRDPDVLERWTRFADHPYLPVVGRPNYQGTRRRGTYPEVESIKHNSYGFRTHEFPTQKHPEDYFVVCLGASTVYGASESNDTTWPAQLEKKLAEAFPSLTVKVFNLGIDGGATPSDIVALSLVGIHLRPDLVIVYSGINDEGVIATSNFRVDYSHFYRDLDLHQTFNPFFLAIPDVLLRSRIVVLLLDSLGLIVHNDLLAFLIRERQPWVLDNLKRGTETLFANFRTLHAIASSVGAEVLFSTLQFRDVPAAFQDDLRRFLVDGGYAFADQDMLIPDHDPTINFDEVHFTTKGDAMMAANFFSAIIANNFIARRQPVSEVVALPF